MMPTPRQVGLGQQPPGASISSLLCCGERNRGRRKSCKSSVSARMSGLLNTLNQASLACLTLVTALRLPPVRAEGLSLIFCAAVRPWPSRVIFSRARGDDRAYFCSLASVSSARQAHTPRRTSPLLQSPFPIHVIRMVPHANSADVAEWLTHTVTALDWCDMKTGLGPRFPLTARL